MRSRSFRSRSRSSAASSNSWLETAASSSRLQGLQTGQRLLQARRRRGPIHAHPRRCLVDQVDRLVRHEPIGDVAGSHVRGGLQRLVGDLELVVVLVERADPGEDQDRLLDARLVDLNRLESPLQRRVPLDVLAVLVERRRADRLQLTSRERGLEDVGGIDRALGGSRPDQRVQLVDEEDAAGLLDLADDLLQALFELAAVLRARDQRADIERDQPLVLQLLGNIAADDSLRQPLDDGRLADARFADQRRIVLRPPRQDLHDPVDLGRSSDERTELAGPGRLGEIDAERVHIRCLGLLLALAVRRALAHDLHHLGANLLQIHAQALQDAGGDALALAHQAQQQMLGADVVVIEPPRLVDRQLDDFLGPRRQTDLAHDHGLATANDEFNRRANLRQLDAHVAQDPSGDAITLTHKTQKEVLRSDVVVVETLGFLLRKRQHLPGALGKFVELVRHPWISRRPRLSGDAATTVLASMIVVPR